MISYLIVNDIGLCELSISFSNVELWEAELIDDNALYLHCDLNNLNKVELALPTFYKAFSSIVNKNKLMAVWVWYDKPPLWKLHPQFRWISRGTPVHYLGCKIGID